jgi:ABC-type Fe3+/spermidine/putrescine transport system ATPase subunit
VILSPPILLLDEPLGALDSILRDHISQELRLLAQRSAVVLVSHNREDVCELADRVVVLSQGRISQDVMLGEFLKNPRTPFAAQFSGEFNVLPSGFPIKTGESGAGKSLAIRRSLIRRHDRLVGSEPGVRATVISCSHTDDTPAKVHTVLDANQSIPFVYFEHSSSRPLAGTTVSLSWPESAMLELFEYEED